MNIHVHTVVWNEEKHLPVFLEYYSQFASRIFVHDNGSSDGTARIARAHEMVELLTFDTSGELRDDVQSRIKGQAWRGRGADWIIAVDCDEFVSGPRGIPMLEVLARYQASGAKVVRAEGWHVAGERVANGARLLDECRSGLRDSHYDKPVCFHASVGDLNFLPGAHGADPVDPDGSRVTVAQQADLPLYLLHLKFCQPLEELLERHRQVAARRSQMNRERGWGWEYDDPQFAAARYRQVHDGAVRLPTALD